mmetsp:Transcript_19918/g.46345  ORF Transcript_19918/g.46345 Transcript_19918/m.46345 type:complete len:346 (-) Transcript_19918:536-1573(-)|eukprot:CAMPEP_0178425018 /NCGR_PEP_ID=MMETSP0689_2-20121128/28508_1 /TAXON_ID=160604 /ORGANISM="Amphidinium massartii, Strain CS-259" /LENGTH=345 /DNA_ID=CAMNT_0020046671 /DNA_START=87 /DNA_END=1124 /DNA_ORIENTATION=+
MSPRALPPARFSSECRIFINGTMYEHLISVALYDGALAVLSKGDQLAQVQDIKGATAFVQGVGVAVFVGDMSVARLWLPSTAAVQKFTQVFPDVVAADASKDTVKQLNSRMKSQRRSAAWLRTSAACFAGLEKLGSYLPSCHAQSATAVWLSWQAASERAQQQDESKRRMKTSGTFVEEDLQGYLGTIPVYHESLGRNRVTCSVSLQGDVLEAKPLDVKKKPLHIILHGRSVNLAQKLVMLWTSDHVLIARLFFNNESDSARWAGLLQAASRLMADAKEHSQKKSIVVLPPPKKSAGRDTAEGDDAALNKSASFSGSLRGRFYNALINKAPAETESQIAEPAIGA